MISVGIIGGTGYTGKYLIEYCSNHEHVAEMHIYAKESAGQNLIDLFPEFEGSVKNQKILYIKGANTDPCVNIIKPPIKTNVIIKGANQYFFLILRKSHMSLIKSIIFSI